METTAAETSAGSVFDTPGQFGFVFGIALGILARFLLSFDLVTLGIGFGVLGAALAVFGDRPWTDVGRALVAVAGVSILTLQTLVLVFG